MVIRKIRKKEKMKTYYKITKDITLIEGENLLQLKKGEILFSAYLLNDKEMCAILGKDSVLSLNLVTKNPEIFEEISKEEFEFEMSLSTVRNLFLGMEAEERNRIIEKLYKEFIPQITFDPIPTQPLPYNQPQNCFVCGQNKNNPCGSIQCPNRLQIWYTSNTTNK
jgi:hypothetical protein